MKKENTQKIVDKCPVPLFLLHQNAHFTIQHW